MFPNLDVDYYVQNNNIFWKRHIFIIFITTDLYIYIFFQVLKISEVELIYSIILVSGVQHSDIVFL